MTPTVDNVLNEYLHASDAARVEGMAWYDEANAYARKLDIKFHRSAGVIAALSPNNSWSNNRAKAAQLYYQGHGEGCGIGANVRKALAIRSGEDALDILGGNKVRAFYLSIVDPTGSHDAVIDRHAFDIAIGERTNDKARMLLSRKGEYARFSEVYIEAASIAQIGTAQMQAVTWCAWRGRHGIYW